MTKVFIMQFISCCGIQASEVVLIVSIGIVDSYVGKSTAGKNTGDQNWRNKLWYIVFVIFVITRISVRTIER